MTLPLSALLMFLFLLPGHTVLAFERPVVSSPPPPLPPASPLSRREILLRAAIGSVSAAASLSSLAVAVTLTGSPASASAFDNKISNKYDDRPKRRGAKPKELGISNRTDLGGQDYLGLKPCGPAPNCFVSTDDVEDDPDHVIPAWTWPTNLDRSQAWEELIQVLHAYKPGQANVDGGGFQIVTSDPQQGYLYVQFESLKNGYIDDFEAWSASDSKAVQVRSSSRLGYLDFGVNAKRLNYLANDLRAKGWDAPGVAYKTHQNYVIQNELE